MKSQKAYAQSLIEPFKKKYGLFDWKIQLKVSYKKKGIDTCGYVITRPEYKEAAITVFPKIIEESAKLYDSETIYAVIEHEFCEIVVWSCFMHISDKILDNKDFEKDCDILAEKIRIMMNDNH